MSENEHKGHRNRLKQAFLKQGLDNFHDHQILELLLFYGVRQGDTNPTAHRLIERFGSLSAVFDASYEELITVKGVGDTCATLIKMIPQISRSYNVDKEKGKIINSTKKAGEFILPHFIGRTIETFFIVCVDSKCKVLLSTIISEGDVSSASVNVRKIVENALRCNAFGVFLSHNHPGGVAIPTKEDIITTAAIQKALYLVNVEVIDHLIVADNDFVSLSDSGLLKQV